MGKFITVTRKIQLLFNTENESDIKEHYKTLFLWQNIVYKAANLISTTHYAMEKIKDMFFIEDETKKKLADISKDVDGILTTSKTNSTYQMLSKLFKGQIPTAILTSLNSSIVRTFEKEKKDYYSGTRSLRSYKRDIPIPIRSVNMVNIHHSKKYERDHNFAFTLYGIPFKTNFGRDLSGNKIIFERAVKKDLLPDWLIDLEPVLSDAIKNVGTTETITVEGLIKTMIEEGGKQKKKIEKKNFTFNVSGIVNDDEMYYRLQLADSKLNFFMFKQPQKEGEEDVQTEWTIESEYKFCDSSIQIKGNKFFLLATFQFRKDKFAVDKETIAECYLDIETPIILKIDGHTYSIGNKEEYLYQRNAIQNVMRKTQIHLRFVQGGRGRNKKLKNLDRFKDAENNYVTTRIHTYSHKLISLCLKHKAGTIVLKNQIEKEKEAKDEEFLLRNWSYHSLKDKISYKASMCGIDVKVE